MSGPAKCQIVHIAFIKRDAIGGFFPHIFKNTNAAISVSVDCNHIHLTVSLTQRFQVCKANLFCEAVSRTRCKRIHRRGLGRFIQLHLQNDLTQPVFLVCPPEGLFQVAAVELVELVVCLSELRLVGLIHICGGDGAAHLRTEGGQRSAKPQNRHRTDEQRQNTSNFSHRLLLSAGPPIVLHHMHPYDYTASRILMSIKVYTD